MAETRAEDLFALARDVAAGWSALARWRAALAADPEAHADDDPLEPVRRVAGKSTWDALRGLSPSVLDAPLRDALERWVFALTQTRIGLRDEATWARLTNEARGTFAGEEGQLVTWREAWRGVASARGAAETQRWLDAAAPIAPELAPAARASAARRLEVARRFGFAHPWEGLLSTPPGALLETAARWLDTTEDLSRAVRRERSGAPGGGAAVTIHAAVLRDVGEGWPPRPTAHWLEDLFGGAARDLPVQLPRLPAPLGASSFLRTLASFGFAARIAFAPRALPFPLVQAPAFVSAHRLAYVFGALPAEPEWQRRALHVGDRVARAQARALARAMLYEARLQAARVLLADDASPVTRDRFLELTDRVFGAELDPRFAGAWPTPRFDEPARWIGLLESWSFAAALRERFDSDWYRNPEAWAHLRALGSEPVHAPIDPDRLATAVEPIARAFERALG